MNLQLPFHMLPLCLGLLFSPLANLARAQDLPRYINVTGTADVKVAPDEVVINLGVETTHKNIRDAIKLNDERLKKLIAVLEKQGIDPKHIQPGLIRVTPNDEESQHQYGKGAQAPILVPQAMGQTQIQIPVPVPGQADEDSKIKDYTASKLVVVKSKDLPKLEVMLIGVYESGFATVQNVSYQNTSQKKIQETLRTKAIQAAREKAEMLTAALGQKIGKAIRIEESGSGLPSPGYGAYPVYSTPAVYVVGGLGQAPEQITVSANVTVWFELP